MLPATHFKLQNDMEIEPLPAHVIEELNRMKTWARENADEIEAANKRAMQLALLACINARICALSRGI